MNISRRHSMVLGSAALAGFTTRDARAIPKPPAEGLYVYFNHAVRLKAIEVLQRGKRHFVRVRTDRGAEGIISANSKLPDILSLFERLVAPYFLKRDVRNLPGLVDGVYTHNRNYKYAGMPFWNSVAHVELAVFDLLSRQSGQPVGKLLGEVIRDEIPVYVSRFDRDTTPQQEVRNVSAALAETGAKATKLKIGRRMFNTPEQTRRDLAMLELARKTWGDKIEIFVDANGSYRAKEAIEIGREMEKLNIGFFEEPCRWQDYQGTLAVADALRMPVAGGEQDSSLEHFHWMTQRKVVDLVQPDVYYLGGLTRMLRVARMADQFGMKITPHSPKTGADAAANLHFASVVPNLGPYQEYRHAPEVRGGKVAVPREAGLGVEYDARDWRDAKIIASIAG